MENKKLKILVIDDDGLTRGMYTEVFRKNGFNVEEAVDGLEGLDKAIKNTPDIVFTGIIMPKMDGFELMNNLKKNVVTSKIPVVISSHMGREEDQIKAKDLGAKDFIIRDITTPNEVIERIRAIFSLSVYRVGIERGKFDADKLSSEMHFGKNLTCLSCGADLVLSLEIMDSKEKIFKAQLVCPKCHAVQD